MPDPDDTSPPVMDGAREFATTHWSVVLAAHQGSSMAAGQALESLCRAYWYPLYAFVRRSGVDPEDSRDLTQEFFARLLAKGWLSVADPARGRFRSFLIASLKHFLANEWHRTRRLKRGGGRALVGLDVVDAEQRYGAEPRGPATPEQLYDRQWASTLVARAQDRLRDEFETGGRADRFAILEPTLVGDLTSLPYAELSAQLGVTISAVKSMVQRFRKRYGELVRDEVAQTTGSVGDVEAELAHLLAVLGDS